MFQSKGEVTVVMSESLPIFRVEDNLKVINSNIQED